MTEVYLHVSLVMAIVGVTMHWDSPIRKNVGMLLIFAALCLAVINVMT